MQQGMEAFSQQPSKCTILGVEPLALFKLSDDANSDILDAAGLVEQQVRPSLSLVDKLGILAVTRIFKLNSMYLFVHMCLIYNIIIVIKLHGLKRKGGVKQSLKTSPQQSTKLGEEAVFEQ